MAWIEFGCLTKLRRSSSECESILDTDKQPLEEEICDINVFEEENEDEKTSSDMDQETDCDSSEEVPITVGNATYYAIPFPGRLRRRHILTPQSLIDAAPKCQVDAFKLFYRPEIILQIVHETNRKARNVRHKCKLLPNSGHKDFTIEVVEAGLAIMIPAGLDRDNFTDLRRLWDPLDCRPFYRVTISLNRFKFTLRGMHFDNCRN